MKNPSPQIRILERLRKFLRPNYLQILQALSALKTISFFAFAIFLNSHRSIDFIETQLLNQIDRVGELKKEIIGKCEELLPRDVRDNKVMGQFGANHILLGKCVIK